MDGQLLRKLYHELFHNRKRMIARRCTYSDAIILWIHFIAVTHDRSHYWAHDKRNWPLWSRGLARPSYSQLMRRLQTPAIQTHLEALDQTFRSQLANSHDKAVDGKPLVVGAYSKDRDAKRGRLSSNAWGRGYKLHAIVDAHGGIDAYAVTGLNAGESTVAQTLLKNVDLRGATLRADANYDSGPLYTAVADRGGRLVAPRRKPGRGLGHRQHHPHRLQAIAEFEDHPSRGLHHKRHRLRIEQIFGHLTNLPFGLAPLPNCVRRQARVERWIAAKIVLYHLHLALQTVATHAA
jgi:hypothetical protein